MADYGRQDAVFFNSQPAKASLCTVSGSSVETQSVIIMSSSQLWGNVDAPRVGGGVRRRWWVGLFMNNICMSSLLWPISPPGSSRLRRDAGRPFGWTFLGEGNYMEHISLQGSGN